jgi:hypothetical protein
MDVFLDDAIGMNVVGAIRAEHDNPNVNTCIVALTTFATEKISEECLEAAMQKEEKTE